LDINVGSNHLPLASKRQQLDFVQSLNRKHLDDRHGDDKLDSVIQSMELGFRYAGIGPGTSGSVRRSRIHLDCRPMI